MPDITEPVFFVSVGRSGSTVTFEAFARHEQLGGPTVYTREFPRVPQFGLLVRLLDNRFVSLRGRKPQPGPLRAVNKVLPKTAEAYPFWNLHTGRDFHRSYLLDDDVTPAQRDATRAAVARLLRWQGRPRFATKLTGPSRIGFLRQIFPDAKFVHVIRDGRAVVHSLLGVAFWVEGGGLEAPWWSGGLDEGDLAPWRATGDPAVLAAIQWAAIIRHARAEAAELPDGAYTELRYEDFVEEPEKRTHLLHEWAGLPRSRRVEAWLDRYPVATRMNLKYRQAWAPERLAAVTAAAGPLLEELGYA